MKRLDYYFINLRTANVHSAGPETRRGLSQGLLPATLAEISFSIPGASGE